MFGKGKAGLRAAGWQPWLHSDASLPRQKRRARQSHCLLRGDCYVIDIGGYHNISLETGSVSKKISV
jgi:hypothetical protein